MQVKPGVRTTEFATAIVTAIIDFIPNFASPTGKWAATIAAAAYALSRGIAKWGIPYPEQPQDFTANPPAAESTAQQPTRPAAANAPTEEIV